MEIVHERCAAVDISKADAKVCIRVPGQGRRRRKETRTFTTMTRDLLAMRDWLLSEGITVVGMEATGDYWKPIFAVLENDVECWLLNARHIKAVPGRKTDCQGRRVAVRAGRARSGPAQLRAARADPATA